LKPDGSLNDCLQCDEDKSGPNFKWFSGRTRYNFGNRQKGFIYDMWCIKFETNLIQQIHTQRIILTRYMHCHWWKFWSRDPDVSIIVSIITIKNEKKYSNYDRNVPKLWVILIFRLVAYLLHVICLKL